jgi:hypothetical protein
LDRVLAPDCAPRIARRGSTSFLHLFTALTTTRVSPADSSGLEATSHPAVGWTPRLIAAATLVAGIAAALHYSRLGLALAHYDARAHLVVARRILDSLTPGWQQIGAVWLPLPHVLNMLPVQVDAWYRSGASGIAISIASLAVATWALARLLMATTGSVTAAVTGAALLVGNPNLLYLQSTPMTEPLLLATCLVAIVFTAEWVDRGAPLPPRRPGLAIVAACMTRYEAWPICGALIVLAGLALLRRGPLPDAAAVRPLLLAAVRACGRLAVYPAVAGVLFLLNSRWTTGTWFVPSGFFVPENKALANAGLAFDQVRESVYLLSGTAWVRPAYVASALVTAAFIVSRRKAPLILALAMAGAVVLPWYAFYDGHPLRVRYGLPLVAACAVTTAAGIAVLWKPLRPVAAAAVLIWAFTQSRPLDHQAPLVVESQRDAANQRERAAVTAYLQQHWDGSTIMMSMGSLAHYMHDLTALRMHIRDFLQEGNEQLWVHAASQGPRGFVKWVVIEERAEGGDVLFQSAQRDAHFLDGFDRVAEGGGVALYRARE